MRLPELDPDTLDPRQREVYDAIVAGPRGKVRGPLAIWLQRPGLADPAQTLGAYCRYGTLLEPALSELAILVTARLWQSEYEWAAHKQLALAAGPSPAIILAVLEHRTPSFETDRQRAVYDFATELNRTRRITDATYDFAQAKLGAPALVDLVGILGYYTLISMTINAFELPNLADAPNELAVNPAPSGTGDQPGLA